MTILRVTNAETPKFSTAVEIGTALGYWLSAEKCIDVADALEIYAVQLSAMGERQSSECQEAVQLAKILTSVGIFARALASLPKHNPEKWNCGPPPYIGWWNASSSFQEHFWRWWDGANWSDWAVPAHDCLTAEHFAKLPQDGTAQIHWRWQYPDNARVQRIDPHTGQPCKITHPPMPT